MNQHSVRTPDAPERAGAAHMRDANDQGRKHQGRDDHLDQAQEDVGDAI